jgi:hypothetical protein
MKSRLPVKLAFVFTLRWDSADFFRTTKKLLRFVQECREIRGDIAWRYREDEEQRATNTKKGEAETENVDNVHE